MGLRNLSRWQWTTILTLTVGYAGYYFCRSNLSVVAPLLKAEFAHQGLDDKAMGNIFSLGVMFYAGGKFANGVLGDFIGGRRMFLFGMLASIMATIVFGLAPGAYAGIIFLVTWAFNRLVQSMGWGALVKTASRWFPVGVIGTVLGLLCLSFFFGDVLARLVLGELVDRGIGWRGVFFAAAGIFAGIFLINKFLLKASPKDVGEEEPPSNPESVFGERGNEERPSGILDLLLPFVTSLSFWVICIMNFGLTIVRETFNSWTPIYLVDVVEMAEGPAGKASSLFPFFGGLSVVTAGFISDKFANGKRGSVMFAFLAPSAVFLFLLSAMDAPESPILPLVCICGIGFLILGPYAFLSGCISVDLGGKKGSATAAGLADCVGYGGGILSGRFVGGIAQDYGWTTAFTVLAVVLVVTSATSLVYWYIHELNPSRKRPPALSEAAPEPEG
jgi:OPA family glycerol-3-phosphate transporter-like MFS transporter